ncbi:MAG: heparinase II/III family protein [Candidatus Brocadiia bacterium]
MNKSITQKIAERAEYMTTALADAAESIGQPRPETISVGGRELKQLSFDARAREIARSAIDGFPGDGAPQPRRGQGDELWDKNVGAIKFGFLVRLAAGWQNTGDEEYAEAARDYLEDFMDHRGDDPFDGEVRTQGRVGHWLSALPYFLDSDLFEEKLVRRIVDSARVQLNWLVGSEMGRGNVRLMMANTFVKGRLLLPFIEESEDWIQRARDNYRDAARRDVEADGSHIEHDPHYHKCYQGAFENLLLWSRAFPEEELPAFPELAARIFDYAVASRLPNNEECGVQDGVGAWIGEGSMDSLLERRAEVRRLAGLKDDSPPLAQAFPDAGQVFMRTGWEPDDQYVIFDGTRWGGAHSHLARNGIQLHAFGRTLVADPGFFSYWMQHSAKHGDELDNRIGPYAKSTPAHNTLNLNGWNQAPVNPNFLDAYLSPDCHAVASRYAGGYWPGWYGWWFGDGFGAGVHAEHSRILIWLPDRAAVVIDSMVRWDEERYGDEEQQNPRLEMNWQLSPGPVTLEEEARRVTTHNDDANVLMLFPRLADNMTLSVKKGQMDPFRGWIGTGREARPMLEEAGVFDDPELAEWKGRSYAPAPQVCAVAEPMNGYNDTMVTVLVPFEGQNAPGLEVDSVNCDALSSGTVGGNITLQWEDGTRDTVVWTPELKTGIGEYKDVLTDGCVLHTRQSAEGEIVRGTTLDATFCEPFTDKRRSTAGPITL